MAPEERKALISEIVEALKDDERMLTDNEHRWVKLAIEKEAQSIQFRRAIINHTLTGLVWASLVFVARLIIKGLESHGFKP